MGIKALVVLSGGQDSITCLGVAIQRFGAGQVGAIGFNYGQQHSVELKCAQEVCSQFEIDYRVIDVSFLGGLVTSSLTGEGNVNDAHPDKPNLPASFVPNRNALFLTIAHAYAQELGAHYIYTGVCQTDYSGYPDCREVFITKLLDALNTGYETFGIAIETPLMHLTKSQTFELADQIGFLDTVLNHSHTCYEGDHTKHNEWGFGCGQCPACALRKKGFMEFRANQSALFKF